MKIYILYENPDWLTPLVRELERARLPFEPWYVQTGHIDLSDEPPQGIFLNRMSPSSHTRGHVESVNFMRELLVWLESHGRRVINNSKAFALEISKVRQYAGLRRFGLRTPHTLMVCGGAEALQRAARRMPLPFITKHNRGGKGLGVQLFHTLSAFDAYVESAQFVLPPDDITLLQEYIEAPEPYITRVEFVGGEFLYAIRSDTTQGFQLCPAERCESDDTYCPVGEDADTPPDRQNLFELCMGFDDPILVQYKSFVDAYALDLVGIEFVEDRHGNKITYDVNATTNYSPGVEERHGLNGWAVVTKMLARELKQLGNELSTAN